MQQPTRRDVLRTGALGAAALLAGCASGSDGGPETEVSTTDAPEKTTQESPPGIEGWTTREAVVYPLVDTLHVSGADAQFLFATVEPHGDRVDPETFAVHQQGTTLAEGARLLGDMSPSGPTPRIEGLGTAVSDGDPGWLGFPLSASIESAAVQVVHEPTEASWAVPESAVDQLAAPAPRFEAETLTVEATGDRSFLVQVRVRNGGDRTETLRGCVNVGYADRRAFALDVPPGDTREWTWEETARTDQEVTVKTPLGTDSATVE